MNEQQRMATFEDYRTLMFSIAYRMLGSVMEAEDIVQEAYLRYQAVATDEIQYPKAFLSTVVTRLCLDHLKSAKTKREMYVGPWLPEPLLTETNDVWVSPAQQVNTMESISMAFLVLLESLTPAERAVFLLREVFDYDYEEIARIVDKSESTCRQVFSRAKKHITENRPRFESTPEEHQQMMLNFMAAIGEGEMDGLTNLLAEGVTLWSDGGGKVQAATRPIMGKDRVARFFLGIQRLRTPNMQLEVAQLNGKPAFIIRQGDGIRMVLMLDVSHGKIQAIRSVGNPDKLQHLK